ncbi:MULTISPECIES: hypothetical protein [Myxococcus]|uniref:hypothetical protein n=1 Tax=Myxococcus TaxID=32 RepID=UPI00112B9923|nr:MULTISPECIES: hypothetical protein [Myxococcus]QDE80775.1 hypothetical protein BHS07_03960 [Myxococcus xanthus]WAM27302.1 hypothetical protein OZ403_04025 [Myxococcus sp. NMCA1]
MASPEASVVHSLKQHLLEHGLRGARVSRILVDADPSYLRSPFKHKLEPMTRLSLDDARPDMICNLETAGGKLIAGIEVKASGGDWVKGLGQAHRYRVGVHHAWLAVPDQDGDVTRAASQMARDNGVGLLVLNERRWSEALLPTDPRPLPQVVSYAAAMLEGAPVARSLQLNHPLNYLAVAFISDRKSTSLSLSDAITQLWRDLSSADSRRLAIAGAMTLGLIDMNGEPTVEGRTVADLLEALRFTPTRAYDKRNRLADVDAGLAAVARFVLLRQPAVRLVHRALSERGGALELPKLAFEASQLDSALAGALFLADPSGDIAPHLPDAAYNPSTVFKLKQNLWHAGLLSTKAHVSAGKRATIYQADKDVWTLEPKVPLRTPTKQS